MNQPNIVYILADDLGYGDVSCLNEQAAFQTPHFDEIQANGMTFTDAHATSAVCTPSRYAILTGRYNWRSQLKKGVLGGYSSPLIEPGRLTVAEMLQQQGYKTAAFGKWHLGMDFATDGNLQEQPDFADTAGIVYDKPIRNGPTTYGFDTFFGISASLDMPPYVYIQDDRFTQVPTRWTEGTGKGFFRRGRTADDFDQAEVLEVLTHKVIDQIENWRHDPFFIYFPLTAPHTPILPPKAFQGRSGTNAYGDFVLYCDDIVGRIVAKLKEMDLYQDTLVIFTSDNGCSPMADYRELWQFGHNPSYVFRGHKADIYEGGHRIPLLIQWPARIRAGQICNRLVSLVDFIATLAEITEADIPAQMAEDSVSNLPLWLDQAGYPPVRSIVQQSVDGSLSLRKGDWKLVMCPGSGGWSWPPSGLTIPGAPIFQLFNIHRDVGEQKNIIDDEPDRAREMRQELARIIRRGRSTPGPDCDNQGEAVWDTVSWLNDTK